MREPETVQRIGGLADIHAGVPAFDDEDADDFFDELPDHEQEAAEAQIVIRTEGGAPINVVRTVTENSRTLGFSSQGFERE
jgi:hypothetical protein